jgi:anti-sigma factor RsiW
MRPTVDQEGRLALYLLGKLSDDEQEQIEARLFDDEELHERLRAAADELIDAYLTGALSAEEDRRFNDHFLASPRRRERFLLLQSLRRVAERASTPPTSTRPTEGRRDARLRPRRLWAVAAAAALVAVALFLVWRPRGHPQRAAPEPAPSGVHARMAPTLTAETREYETPAVAPHPPVVRLTDRSSGETRVAMPRSTRAVRFEVAVDTEASSFDVVLKRSDGREAWRAEELAPPPAGRPLVITVPAPALAGERYALVVDPDTARSSSRPAPAVRTYDLRVVHEP